MNNFTEEEVRAAKKTRDAIINGSISEELKSVYMAGEICMWDELRKSHPSPPEGALNGYSPELKEKLYEWLTGSEHIDPMEATVIIDHFERYASTPPVSAMEDGCELYVKCKLCNGQGWTAEHDIMCNGNCECCPVQVQCQECSATGFVLYNKKVESKIPENTPDDLPY